MQRNNTDGVSDGDSQVFRGRTVATVATVLATGVVACLPAAVSATQLPDGRSYEQVSPVEKHGNEAGAERGIPLYTVASPDGSAVFFGTTGPLEAAPSGIDLYSVARRDETGLWHSRAAVPASTDEQANFVEAQPQSLIPSQDMSHLAYTSGSPFVSSNPGGFASVYLAGEDPFVQPAWIGRPTVASPNPPIGAFNEVLSQMNLAGASLELNPIYFTYYGTLVPEDEGRSANVPTGNAWGFYEWRSGTLHNAGQLPDGSYDPFGAVPAAIGQAGSAVTPRDFNNEVSLDGSRAFFVSPDPAADERERPEFPGEPFPLGRAPELYVRESGERSVLVTRSTVTGQAAADGPLLTWNLGGSFRESYAFASPDGSRVFFESVDALTPDAPTNGEPKEYVFNTNSQVLSYAPGFAENPEGGPGSTASVQATSADGQSALVVKLTGSRFASNVDLWTQASDGSQALTRIAALPPVDEERPVFQTARSTADGSVFVFTTNAPIEGFNNAGGFQQIYRYDVATADLSCVSCPPAGSAPSGNAALSHFSEETKRILDNRGMSADGQQIYFDTPDALVPQAVNGRRDVYEWENGTQYLISSGTDSHDSFFLDNSASGSDVFFATAANLAPADTDGAYDVYDARVTSSAQQQGQQVNECSADECQGAVAPSPSFGTPASVTFNGPGNFAPAAAVPVKAKPLTRAQKLAKAREACKREVRHAKKEQCERKARAKYGSVRKKSAPKKRSGRS